MAGLSAALMAPAAQAEYSSLPNSSLVADGPVNAIATAGNNVYLGGSFSTVGPRTGPGVLFNAMLSARDSASPTVGGGNDEVDAVVSDGSGGWYVGGSFTAIGGVARGNLAHILPDGTVDQSFDPEPDNTVNVLTLSGSTLYVGGKFAKIGGQSRAGLASVSTAGGAVSAFDPNPDQNQLCGIAVAGAHVYVCGSYYTRIGGQARHALAELNASDGSATSWDPGLSYSGNASAMYLAPTGVLYVGVVGTFSTEPGTPSHSAAAAFQTSTTRPPALLSFNPDLCCYGSVSAFDQIGNTLYVGGSFSSDIVGGTGQPRGNAAAFDTANNWALLPFDAHANQAVTSVADTGGALYLGGGFTKLGATPRGHLSTVDPGSGAASGSDPAVDGPVNGIAAAGTSVYVGGTFLTVQGSARDNLAVLSASDGSLQSLAPTVDGPVSALAATGSQLYVGGSFNYGFGSGQTSGQLRRNLVAFSTVDGSVSSFDPEPDARVAALTATGSTLYAGGSFGHLGSTAHGPLAAFSTLDGSTVPFDPAPDGTIAALAVTSNRLYAAGSFSKLTNLPGTPPRSKVAAFDLPANTLDAGFKPPPIDGAISAVAASDGAVFAGGTFDHVGSTYRPRLAQLSPADGSLVAGWDPQVSNRVDALALSASTLYAGGAFTDAGGQERSGAAGLDTGSGAATSFHPAPDRSVSALAVGSSGIYLGGRFDNVGNLPQANFASFGAGATGGTGGGSSGGGAGGASTEGSSAGSTPLTGSPSTFITGGPTYYGAIRRVRFDFVSDTPGASFLCSLDGAPNMPCTPPYTTADLTPGAHRFTVHAVSPSGVSDVGGATDSFFILSSGAGRSPGLRPPRLSQVRGPGRVVLNGLSRRRRRGHARRSRHAGRPGFSFRLDQAATVTVTLVRLPSRRCPRPLRRCVHRRAPAGTLSARERAGLDRMVFNGRVAGTLLLAGRYRATLQAADVAGVSRPTVVTFTIVGA